jgi:hypothetical protein
LRKEGKNVRRKKGRNVVVENKSNADMPKENNEMEKRQSMTES